MLRDRGGPMDWRKDRAVRSLTCLTDRLSVMQPPCKRKNTVGAAKAGDKGGGAMPKVCAAFPEAVDSRRMACH